MPGTVVANVSLFTGITGGSTSNCDAITDWGGTPTLDTETFVQGTGSLSKKVSSTTSIHVFTLASALDLSNTQLYVWAACGSISILATKAAGGFKIRVEDAAANWGEWYMAGKDTWTGAWDCFMVHTTTAFSANSATLPTMTAITKAGVVFYTTATVAKINCWWDALRYGTGLAIKAGTEASPATFQDFVDAENTVANKYGVITVAEGILQVQGQVDFGSTTAGEATYFKDTSKVLVFRDRSVPANFYRLLVQGNATATTKVYFGTKSGGAGISGCIFRSVGAAKYLLTATDTNITNLGIYGCTFFDANTISLPVVSGTNREVLNTTFEVCAEVVVSSCIVENCNLISADDEAVTLPSGNIHGLKNSTFISNPNATRIPNTGTYTFDNLKFSGNTVDIDNTSGGLVTVNCVNGANPTTYTGNTVINNYVLVSITVKDEAQANIVGASVRVSKLDDNSVQYMNELTGADGKAEESINYPGAVSLRIRARKSTTGTRYIPLETTGAMLTTGFTLTVTLYQDGNL